VLAFIFFANATVSSAQYNFIVLAIPALSLTGTYNVSWTNLLNETYHTTVYETQGAPVREAGAINEKNIGASTGKMGLFSVTGRAPGTYYYVGAFTEDTAWMLFTPPKIVEVAPATPTLKSPPHDTTGNISTTWTAQSGATSYQLDQSLDNSSWTTIYTGAATSYSTTSLGTGTYWFRVRSCISATGCSAYSSSSSTVVNLAAPTLSAPTNNTTGSFTLTWSASANVTRYELDQRIDGATWNTIFNGSATSFGVSEYGNGTYDYRVRACNNTECSGNSAIATTLVLLPPPTPVLTVPASSTTGAFSISWSSVATATSYQVDQSQDYGAWATVYNSSGVSTNFFGLGNGFYQYKVRACNTSGCSADSGVQGMSVALPPAAPAGVYVPSESQAPILIVRWDTSPTATYYQLDRRFNGGPWSTIFESNAPLFIVGGMPEDGTYDFQVRACNSSGCSPNSPMATMVLAIVPLQPGPIAGPTTNGDGTYTLTWGSLPVELWGETSYVLQERLNGGDWVTVYNGNNSTYTASGRGVGTYGYRVQACNVHRCGEFSAIFTTVLSVPSVPGAPTAPSTSSDGNFTVSWSSIALASQYELQQQAAGGPWTTIYSGPSTTRPIVSSPGDFNFKVRACNVLGCGAYSGSVAVNVSSGSSVPVSQTPIAMPTVDANDINNSDQLGTTAGTFAVDKSGAATYTVPVAVVAGTAGLVPQIALHYSSRDQNGLLGIGWTISGLSEISRCRQNRVQDGVEKPITWTAEDRYCLDGQRLVLISGTYGSPGSTYKLEIDNQDVITALGGTPGFPAYFKTQHKDGSYSFYGDAPNTRDPSGGTLSNTAPSDGLIYAGGNPGKIYTWRLRKYQDSVGNPIWYMYGYNSGFTISEIRYAYGANSGPANYGARIVFGYESRPDYFDTGYIGGYGGFTNSRRVNSITSENEGVVVRRYNLSYLEPPNAAYTGPSHLNAIQECGLNNHCLANRTEFSWTPNPIGFSAAPNFSAALGPAQQPLKYTSYVVADINGDGCADLIYQGPTPGYLLYYAMGTCTSVGPGTAGISFTPSTYTNGSASIDLYAVGMDWKVIDYNGDGRSDLIIKNDSIPNLTTAVANIYLSTPQPDGTWRLAAAPIQRPIAPNQRFSTVADLNADGLSDLMLTNTIDNTITTYYMERDAAQPVSSNRYYQLSVSAVVPSQACPSSTNPRMSVLPSVNGTALPSFQEIEGRFGTNYPITLQALTGPYSTSCYAASDNSAWTAAGGTIFPPLIKDFNTDGLPDVAYLQQPNGWRLQLNTGAGFAAPVELWPGSSSQNQWAPWDILDFNADGYNDLFGRFWNPTTQRFSAEIFSLPSFNIVRDLNGDGIPDGITVTGSGNLVSVYLGNGPNSARNVIWKFQDGLGAIITLNYENIHATSHYQKLIPGGAYQSFQWNGASYTRPDAASFYTAINTGYDPGLSGQQALPRSTTNPIFELTGPMYVVTSMDRSAPATSSADMGATVSSAASRTTYFYGEGKVESSIRGFLGFHTIKTVDESTGLQTVTQYRQDFPFIGKPFSTEIYTRDNQLVSRVWNWWGFKNFSDPNYFLPPLQVTPEPTVTWVRRYDAYASGNPLLSSLTTTTIFDVYDNKTSVQIETHSDANRSNLIAKQVVSAAYSAGLSLQRGLPNQVTITSSRPGVVDRTRTEGFKYFCIDDSPCPSSALTGLLYKDIVEPNLPALQLTTTFSYDSFGNRAQAITSAVDMVDRSTSWFYDTRSGAQSSGRYLDRTINSLGQTVSEVISRNELGLPAQINEPNGLQIHYRYGSFGRPYLEYSNTGGYAITLRYSQLAGCLPGAVFAEKTQSSDGSIRATCFDVLARPQRFIDTGFDDRAIYVDTEYDSAGRAVHKTEPRYDGPAYFSSINFDQLGRVIAKKFPDGSTATTQYSGLTETHTDANGHTTTIAKNPLNEVVTFIDHKGTQILNTYNADGSLHSTSTIAGVGAAPGLPSTLTTNFT